ncbi:MAG: hypothetical protein ACYTF9_07200 [Planctomycetota bacterium]|jgi:hypothetical protein
MLLSGRRLLIGLAIVIAAIGVVIWIEPAASWLAIVVAACGLLIAIVLNAMNPGRESGPLEPDDIAELPRSRQAELMRGTSMHLREMQYRYSVRMESSPSPERPPFNAEINGVPLGFIPALMIDNDSDKQGYGYVAFVFDQRRWRGPGLPCPAGQAEAVAHAARCVAPLDDGQA